MQIGVIGLGDIAQKAYLPIYGKMDGVQFHLHTRNVKKLDALGDKHRFTRRYARLEDLLESGISAAFVHSSTESHAAIVRELLQRDIHVFVDKPITDQLSEAEGLVRLANERKLILMVGFNRRYAPAIRALKEVAQPNMVIVQKNRHSLPGEIRSFIYDDFIHVVDTIRFLFPYPIDKVIVNGRQEGGKLCHAVVQLVSRMGTAIGIMNRDNGTMEEIAAVMGPLEKRTAYNLSRLIVSKGIEETEIRGNDWEETLVKRGFPEMVNDFLQAVRTGTSPKISAFDALETHRLCEEIIVKLSGDFNQTFD
ncbi:gfo/Idh/MocA family oxidoreductase [Neobacillus piezotolerans]|uniref:Gfo/Idh/MocA family oxidoreductase n=1 Tax=Neobacillus piezotolerans TaxID=2259171 RepID=A0A3D8GKI9_9BACI|nr:Gfo/Idh/MocA family oxidoreductase [Neobacillus piezotolerans]RDU34851.1 gfo/Idh/MocA family oxidoreductase [Neobacillus piezotolerans]